MRNIKIKYDSGADPHTSTLEVKPPVLENRRHLCDALVADRKFCAKQKTGFDGITHTALAVVRTACIFPAAKSRRLAAITKLVFDSTFYKVADTESLCSAAAQILEHYKLK